MPQHAVTLYYRAGTSDKVYSVNITEEAGLHRVNFAYGRRGSTLQTGSKTSEPVDFATAKHIFDKLVREKMQKGYTPGANSAPCQEMPAGQRATGILPQLLNPVDEPGALRLLRSPDHWMQEKFDGRRVLLRKAEDGTLTGINRRGLSIGLPEPILTAARRIPGGFIVDGEALGDRLVCFDCLLRLGVDAAALPYRQRLLLLASFINSGPLQIINTAKSAADKHALFNTLQARSAEGVVFKDIGAAYTPGRPASGGAQLKHKFVATASCLVAQHNSQRSVGLALADTTGRQIRVGNVTIPPNHAVPSVGAVVEVRYLYAYPGGSLFQPVYQGARDDITADACTIRQLKHKAADDDDA